MYALELGRWFILLYYPPPTSFNQVLDKPWIVAFPDSENGVGLVMSLIGEALHDSCILQNVPAFLVVAVKQALLS